MHHTKHASQTTSLQKLLKDFANCCSEKLKDTFNKCLQENKIPDLMKKDKNKNTSKDNYRPISTLSKYKDLQKYPFRTSK